MEASQDLERPNIDRTQLPLSLKTDLDPSVRGAPLKVQSRVTDLPWRVMPVITVAAEGLSIQYLLNWQTLNGLQPPTGCTSGQKCKSGQLVLT